MVIQSGRPVIFITRCYAERSIATASRLYVRLSVYDVEISWSHRLEVGDLEGSLCTLFQSTCAMVLLHVFIYLFLVSQTQTLGDAQN